MSDRRWTLTCGSCGQTVKRVAESSDMTEPGVEATVFEHKCWRERAIAAEGEAGSLRQALEQTRTILRSVDAEKDRLRAECQRLALKTDGSRS